MTNALMSTLLKLADQADEDARLALEARDAEFFAGRANGLREAALIVQATAEHVS